MKDKTRLNLWLALGLTLALGIGIVIVARGVWAQEAVPQGTALGTGFTYQGLLTDTGTGEPIAGPCDLRFSLYGSLGGNDPLGAPRTAPGVRPDNGYFAVDLDFGSGAFQGDARYLKVEVDCGSGFVALGPRVALNAAPYALYARSIPLAGSGTSTSAARSDHNHDAAYQARVNGACPVGSTIRAVNANGTVTCQADAPLNRPVAPTDNVSTTLDADGITGVDTSVTIGVDGLGLISYYDASKGVLKVAHCHNPACTGATITTLDSSADVGGYSSIAIGADGLGLISYRDASNGTLKVAHCSNVACTSATRATVDNSGMVQFGNTSLAIGADGLGLISYYDYVSGLMVAHCDDTACTTAGSTALVAVPAEYNSLTIGGYGLGLISYYDGNDNHLKLAHCQDVACTGAWLFPVDCNGDVGRYNSITTGSDGLPLISYFNATTGYLKAAHCDDVYCTTVVSATLEATSVTGEYTSITTGADGLGVISYRDATKGTLKVAHCANLACTTATVATVDADQAGYYTSITIGPDGLPLIGYLDFGEDDFKVLHCASSFCLPYFRHR